MSECNTCIGLAIDLRPAVPTRRTGVSAPGLRGRLPGSESRPPVGSGCLYNREMNIDAG